MLARWLVSRDRKGQNLGINACSMAYESRPRSCNSPGSTCRDQCQPTGLGGGTIRDQRYRINASSTASSRDQPPLLGGSCLLDGL